MTCFILHKLPVTIIWKWREYLPLVLYNSMDV
jgi:hypothetical protein